MITTAVFAAVAITPLDRTSYAPSSAWFWRIPPYAICGMAGYWVFERVAGFLGEGTAHLFCGR